MVNTDEIKRRLQQLKMTQKRFGEVAKLSQSMVSYILSGKRSPRLATMKRIAKALGCTVDDLLIG